MSNCPGTFLLDYTAYPDEILDEIDPESVVNIFVFDTEDICSDVLQYTYGELVECNYEFKVPIAYRERNAVVWHGNDSEDYDDSSMAVGTSLEDFYLRLIKNTEKGIGHAPSMLWASNLEKVEFCASKTRHRIHMTKVDTQVDVTLNMVYDNGDVVPVDMIDYKATITAKDNVYHIDCTICDSSETLVFDNSEEIAENTELDEAHVGTLRLMPESDSYLYLTNVKSGNRVSVGSDNRIDLVKYMLDSRGSDIDTEITDQRFLDLNKKWDIALTIDGSFVAVNMTINGWTVWFDDTDLE